MNNFYYPHEEKCFRVISKFVKISKVSVNYFKWKSTWFVSIWSPFKCQFVLWPETHTTVRNLTGGPGRGEMCPQSVKKVWCPLGLSCHWFRTCICPKKVFSLANTSKQHNFLVLFLLKNVIFDWTPLNETVILKVPWCLCVAKSGPQYILSPEGVSSFGHTQVFVFSVHVKQQAGMHAAQRPQQRDSPVGHRGGPEPQGALERPVFAALAPDATLSHCPREKQSLLHANAP